MVRVKRNPVGLRPPLLQFVPEPGPDRLHTLLRPGKRLRLDILRQLKAGVLVDPDLDAAVADPARALEPVPECPDTAGIDGRLGKKIQVQKIKAVFHKSFLASGDHDIKCACRCQICENREMGHTSF